MSVHLQPSNIHVIFQLKFDFSSAPCFKYHHENLSTASPAAPSRRNDRCSLSLSSNSLQELRQLQSQTGGDVSVEVNAAPGEDLTKILNDLRNEYEQIIEKNRREVEQWYEVKVRSNAEVLPSSPSHGKGGTRRKGLQWGGQEARSEGQGWVESQGLWTKDWDVFHEGPSKGRGLLPT